MVDVLATHIEARYQRRMGKYTPLLPIGLAVVMADVQMQLENPRTGLLRLWEGTPEALMVRFGALVALAGETVKCLDSRRLPTRVRDGIELGQVLRDRFAASPDHLAALLLDTEDWTDALNFAESAAEDLRPDADDAAADLDRELVTSGLLQSRASSPAAPSPAELTGLPPAAVEAFREQLATICSDVLDGNQCKYLRVSQFQWPDEPVPSQELLADRMARLWLRSKGILDPDRFLQERGYTAPEGRLKL
jgi:hypothetical protein